MTAILTDKKLVRCYGPPSVYIITIGGMFSLVPYFFMRAFSVSTEFHRADDSSGAIILT